MVQWMLPGHCIIDDVVNWNILPFPSSFLCQLFPCRYHCFSGPTRDGLRMFTFRVFDTRDHSVLDRGADCTVASAILELSQLYRMRAFAQLKWIKILNVFRQREFGRAKL